MSREELARELTHLATDVVRQGHIELALGWLWCKKVKDPLPRVPRHLLDKLVFVVDQGQQEIDAAYKGRDYFEDCLWLAFRQSQYAAVSRAERRSGEKSRHLGY